MEHRWHERKPAELAMVVKYSKLGSMRGRVRNISRGGMLLDTAGMASLKPFAVVELYCNLWVENTWCSYSVRAQVIYSDSGCVGLMFLDHEAAYAKFEALLEYVIASAYSGDILNADVFSNLPQSSLRLSDCLLCHADCEGVGAVHSRAA